MTGDADQVAGDTDVLVDPAMWRVRLHRGGPSGNGPLLGAGVLLGNSRVLTCAHVIRDPVTGGRPARVVVEFPLGRDSPGTPRFTARIVDGNWMDRFDGGRGDLALLELDRATSWFSPVSLYRGVFPTRAPVEMTAFPEHLPGGHPVGGVCLGAGGTDERDVIRLDGTDGNVIPGFSGSGVLQRGTDRVLGIVAEGGPDGFGYMIPSATIAHYLHGVRDRRNGHYYLSGRPVIHDTDVVDDSVVHGAPLHGLQRTVDRWLARDPASWDVEILFTDPKDAWAQDALRLVLALGDRGRSPLLGARGGTADRVGPADSPAPAGAAGRARRKRRSRTRGVTGLGHAGIRPGLGSIDLVLNLRAPEPDPAGSDALTSAFAGLDEALRHTQPNGLSPAVAVLATSTAPGLGPEEIARALKERAGRGVRFLVVLAHGDETLSRAVLGAGLVPQHRAATWLGRLRTRVDALTAVEEKARRVYSDVERQVIADTRPTTYATGERRRILEIVAATRAAHEPLEPALLELLSRAEQSVEIRLLRADHALQDLRAARRRWRRQRDRLAHHQERLHRHGRAEHPDALPLFRAAQEMLLGAFPPDDTRAAVERFAKTVHALTDGRTPGGQAASRRPAEANAQPPGAPEGGAAEAGEAAEAGTDGTGSGKHGAR